MTPSPQHPNETPPNAARRGLVLVVDDERNIRSMLQMLLRDEGYEVEAAADGTAAEAIFALRVPDVILLDIRMPGRSGLVLLKEWHAQLPNVPIILMSGEATITEALAGLKEGAYDFVEKPFLTARLLHALNLALERLCLQQAVAASGDDDALIGQSAALKKVLADVAKIAPTRSRVLITGESGTGKDLIARELHRSSARRAARFVKINCAAIPAELIESELFGHVKGAFTGAHGARRGFFEAAHGGTLFLDEVGDLSLAAQAKILRALQNGEITPVGSNVTQTVDVRVIAATNRNLKTAVENGRFREDLYYRLAVVTLASPPLRQRSEDIPLLAQHFLSIISLENGLPPRRLPPAIVEVLEASTKHYSWPGNIRELRNVIERLTILGGPQFSVADLPSEIRPRERQGAVASDGSSEFKALSWEQFKMQSERAYLLAALRNAQGNISEAARVLAVERTTIHKWLKSMQIERGDYL